MQNVLMYKKPYKVTSTYPPRCLENNINTSRLPSLCRPQRNDCSKIPKYSLYLVMIWLGHPFLQVRKLQQYMFNILPKYKTIPDSHNREYVFFINLFDLRFYTPKL